MKGHKVTKSQGHTVILALFLCLVIAGCAGVKEAGRGFAGTSTNILEECRPRAVSRELAWDEQQVIAKIEKALPGMGAYVYARVPEKHLIAIYVSETDTTPVGIYTAPASAGGTTVFVSSPSVYAKEKILQSLYDALTKKKPDDEKTASSSDQK